MTMGDDSGDWPGSEASMDFDDSFEAQMQAHIENGDFDLDLEPGSDSSDSEEDSDENDLEELDIDRDSDTSDDN